MCALGLAVRAIHARVVGRGCLPARACQQDERELDEARFILKSASGLATIQSTIGRGFLILIGSVYIWLTFKKSVWKF